MSVEPRHLLARGARVLGLAAVAHARGRRPGGGPWHVLAPHLVAGVEQALLALEAGPSPDVLEPTVRAAMGSGPATAAPAWAAPLWRDDGALDRLGAAVPEELWRPAWPPGPDPSSDRERGRAALAVAMCRNRDGLDALAADLPTEDDASLRRLAALAAVVVPAGLPSRARAAVKAALVAEERRRG